jgi:hypothetical protein
MINILRQKDSAKGGIIPIEHSLKRIETLRYEMICSLKVSFCDL